MPRRRLRTVFFTLGDLAGALLIARFRPDLSASSCVALERWAALNVRRSWQ